MRLGVVKLDIRTLLYALCFILSTKTFLRTACSPRYCVKKLKFLIPLFFGTPVPNIQPEQVVHLDLNPDDQQLPLVFLIASILSQIWTCRKEKKACNLHTIRATLEASINILRKSRHKAAADTLTTILVTP